MRLNFKQIGIYALSAGLITGVSGCGEDSPLGNLAEECGLVCASEGIVEGNASISGLRSVDAFFGAVVSFSSVAGELSGEVEAVNNKIAVSVGLEPGAGGAEIAAAIDAKIAANVEGDLTVNIVEPKCSASAEVAIEASAKCDVDVDPGSVEVMCMGSCSVEASASAGCEADVEVVCTGTAPALKCAGSCKGECKFEAAASCEGKCMGSCDAECSVTISGGTCEGTCEGDCTVDGSTETGVNGECTGECSGSCKKPAGEVECGGSCAGECTGECMADVSGGCSGSCEGECEYTPPSAECSGSASVECKAEVMAGAMCSGKCEGDVQPPSAKAECSASAKAEADLRVSCDPPSVDIKFAFSAELQADVQAQAEFNAWVSGFKGNIGALANLEARASSVLKAGADLTGAAEGAVTGAVEELSGEADLKASIGAVCALEQLPLVAGLITDAAGELEASISTAAEISGSI